MKLFGLSKFTLGGYSIIMVLVGICIGLVIGVAMAEHFMYK